MIGISKIFFFLSSFTVSQLSAVIELGDIAVIGFNSDAASNVGANVGIHQTGTLRPDIVLERRNMYGVLSGTPDEVRRWMKAAPGRFIPSVQFKIGRDDISPQQMQQLFEQEEFAVLGEISNQYAGIAPDDERMEPYWALAEELDLACAALPVGACRRPTSLRSRRRR